MVLAGILTFVVTAVVLGETLRFTFNTFDQAQFRANTLRANGAKNVRVTKRRIKRNVSGLPNSILGATF